MHIASFADAHAFYIYIFWSIDLAIRRTPDRNQSRYCFILQNIGVCSAFIALTSCSAVEGLVPQQPLVQGRTAVIVGGSRATDGTFSPDPSVVDATGNVPVYYDDLQRCRTRAKRSTLATAPPIRRSIDQAIGSHPSEGKLFVRVNSDAQSNEEINSVNNCLVKYGHVAYK